jgi:transcriptional regulator with XRE-family HTH domain
LHKTSTAAKAALKELGEAIRAERKIHGLSQENLAELADVHMTYVGKVERGEKNVSFENLMRFAAALGMPLSELIRRAGL